MLNALIIIFREGFEAFLIVAITLAYLRKTGRSSLIGAVYAGSAVSLFTSLAFGYELQKVNESFWEGVLGVLAAAMVATFVIQVMRAAPTMKRDMEARIESASGRSSRPVALLSVFLFTVLMITREGMEAALMLIQIRSQRQLLVGGILGLIAAAALSWAWARFGYRIPVRRFFQVTSMFLLLFTLQVLFYSLHEFSEAGMLGPRSDAIHIATEPFSPVGVYGKWISLLMVAVCASWLLAATLKDRFAQQRLAH